MKDEKLLQDELLSDEQLDQVAGGTYEQSIDDAYNFEKIFPGKYFRVQLCTIVHAKSNDIESAFREFGIEAHINESMKKMEENRYYLNGNEISQKEAWDHVYKLAKERGMI